MVKLKHTYHPNPFYDFACTVVIDNPALNRRQHFAIWADTTKAEFIRLARHHLAAVRQPLPEPPPGEYTRIRFTPSRDKDDSGAWA